MISPKRKSRRALKQPPRLEPEPITQDWADAIHTLISAAYAADEMGEKDIRRLCLLEARRILRRGEPDPECNMAPASNMTPASPPS